MTTYGKTVDDCAQAAIGGNKVKAALNWPPAECAAVPARAARRKKRRETDEHSDIGGEG